MTTRVADADVLRIVDQDDGRLAERGVVDVGRAEFDVVLRGGRVRALHAHLLASAEAAEAAATGHSGEWCVAELHDDALRAYRMRDVIADPIHNQFAVPGSGHTIGADAFVRYRVGAPNAGSDCEPFRWPGVGLRTFRAVLNVLGNDPVADHDNVVLRVLVADGRYVHARVYSDIAATREYEMHTHRA